MISMKSCTFTQMNLEQLIIATSLRGMIFVLKFPLHLMLPPVSNQVAGLSETLTTLGTSVWFLSCEKMQLHMGSNWANGLTYLCGCSGASSGLTSGKGETHN